ncbi:MAG: ABC transporter ATP-binding protein [Solirubrobacterales bacterium]|nr:ABC transporter ATP-binding protein [Solirubrobacterales bacterium]
MAAGKKSGGLKVSGVSHAYDKQMVLRDVDLEVGDGEFVTFLGPSGCGKTTLLRIIAGFIEPTKGTVEIGGQEMTGVSSHQRPVNMVFQRPTLFPHLDVFENVAFGLRVDKLPKEEINERVGWALDLVRMPGYEKRQAAELSGGQMQRVALARALVKRPSVLLLDEPLSALDLKIRLEMEAELRRVHRETGATWVYVTHDQREALALSDRIAVFERGRIDQLADPMTIYRAPATPFAAGFVGNANVIACEVKGKGKACKAALAGADAAVADPGLNGPAWLVLRPESIQVETSGKGVEATVRDVAFRGTGFSYRLEVAGLEELVKAEVAAAPEHPIELGTKVWIGWSPDAAIVLPREQ